MRNERERNAAKLHGRGKSGTGKQKGERNGNTEIRVTDARGAVCRPLRLQTKTVATETVSSALCVFLRIKRFRTDKTPFYVFSAEYRGDARRTDQKMPEMREMREMCPKCVQSAEKYE